jgi:hypothetical protein
MQTHTHKRDSFTRGYLQTHCNRHRVRMDPANSTVTKMRPPPLHHYACWLLKSAAALKIFASVALCTLPFLSHTHTHTQTHTNAHTNTHTHVIKNCICSRTHCTCSLTLHLFSLSHTHTHTTVKHQCLVIRVGHNRVFII